MGSGVEGAASLTLKEFAPTDQERKVKEGMWTSIFRSDLTTVYNEHPGFSSESWSSQKPLYAARVLGSLCGASLGFRQLNQISARHVLCILVVISAFTYCHKIFNRGASCLLEGAVTVCIHLLGFRVDTDDHQPVTDTSP